MANKPKATAQAAEEEVSQSAGGFAEEGGILGTEAEQTLRGSVLDREGRYEQGFRQRAVLEIALYTGAKVTELARLTVGDLQLVPSALSIRIPSESNPRVLPLNSGIANWFAKYLEQKKAAGESLAATAPLVCSQRGSGLSVRGWQDAWGLIQRHAGVISADGRPLFSLESARQAAGRRVYRASRNPHHVQGWLGLDLSTNADRYLPETIMMNVEVLRAVLDDVWSPLEVRPHPEEKLRLAFGFYNGTAGVMNRNLARRLLVETSPDDPRAEFFIARCLERGRAYFPINPDLAQRKAAATIGGIRELASEGCPIATFLYATALDEAMGCERNLEEAVVWYEKAISLGVETAYTNLGLLYHWGRGVKRDDARALGYFQQGAALHEASCMFNLGVMYQEGIGTEANLATALRWYHRAATAGEVRSMNNLSYLYSVGLGVPRDEKAAERWYCLAGQLPSARAGVVMPDKPQIEMIRLAG
jgi:TPR repeat protein